MESVKFPTNLLGNSKALYLDLLLYNHIGFDYFLFLFLNFITSTIQLSGYKYIITKTLYKTSSFSPTFLLSQHLFIMYVLFESVIINKLSIYDGKFLFFTAFFFFFFISTIKDTLSISDFNFSLIMFFETRRKQESVDILHVLYLGK